MVAYHKAKGPEPHDKSAVLFLFTDLNMPPNRNECNVMNMVECYAYHCSVVVLFPAHTFILFL